MIKVSVFRNGILTNERTHENEANANAWINEQIARNSWGKPERWVRDGKEDISNALETRNVIDNGVSYEEYKLACQYEIVKEDVGNEPKLEAMRAKRNLLLSQCDWTQLPDAPLTATKKTKWATYRQALRDLPENEDPSSPEWPTKPS